MDLRRESRDTQDIFLANLGQRGDVFREESVEIGTNKAIAEQALADTDRSFDRVGTAETEHRHRDHHQ